jgi:hypothetical protein
MQPLWKAIGVINCVSFLLASTIPLASCRRQKKSTEKRFPNYVVDVVGSVGSVFHMNVFWGTCVGYKQLHWPHMCIFQAAVFQVTTSALMLWLLCLVIVVYLVVCKSVSIDLLAKWEYPVHGVIWMYALVSALVPAVHGNVYQHDEGLPYCWLPNPKSKFVYLFWIWLVLIPALLFTLPRVVSTLHNLAEAGRSSKEESPKAYTTEAAVRTTMNRAIYRQTGERPK